MLTLIDNYDSFTYNLVHFLGELGATARVYRNDKISVDGVMAEKPSAIVLSPGPCDPDRAGICLDLIKRAGPEVPILGVCLGHQAIGQVYGGRIVRAPTLMHGKLSKVHHTGQGVFEGIAQRLRNDLLACDLLKGLRPPFSRDYLVRHREALRISNINLGYENSQFRNRE